MEISIHSFVYDQLTSTSNKETIDLSWYMQVYRTVLYVLTLDEFVIMMMHVNRSKCLIRFIFWDKILSCYIFVNNYFKVNIAILYMADDIIKSIFFKYNVSCIYLLEQNTETSDFALLSGEMLIMLNKNFMEIFFLFSVCKCTRESVWVKISFKRVLCVLLIILLCHDLYDKSNGSL